MHLVQHVLLPLQQFPLMLHCIALSLDNRY
jgi:hypothetical protein